MSNRFRLICLFVLFLFFLIVALLLQLAMGSVSIPLSEVFAALTGSATSNETWRNIILESRLPGALAAALAGAGLSISGLQMQTLFRNPVAGPYVLGISAGASLGVALYLMGGAAFSNSSAYQLLSGWGIILAALAGSLFVFFISVLITLRIKDVVAILIIGLMIGGGISAFIEILQSFSANEALKRYVLWTFGSFRYVDMTQIAYLAVVVIIGALMTQALSKPLNILLLGEVYAESSGIDVDKMKYIVVFCSSLLAGCVTAFCGPIAFVGLGVPHVVRRVFNTYDHRILTPACALIGAIVCSACNVIASSPGTESAMPVNAVTSLLGAPVVIWIILKHRRGT